MNFLLYASRHELSRAVFSLVAASAVGLVVLAARIVLSGRLGHLYLAWNLFLAWLPLLFAMMATHRWETEPRAGWKFRSMCAAWLLFFPNAPYIVTDLMHLWTRHTDRVWIDLTLILMFAWIGLLLGCLSLWLMQRLVALVAGRGAGWAFAAAMAGLAGVGVYLGRFLRWNSWDALLNPWGVTTDILGRAMNPWVHRREILFTVLFGMFVLLVHTTVTALMSLRVAGEPDFLPTRPERAIFIPDQTGAKNDRSS